MMKLTYGFKLLVFLAAMQPIMQAGAQSSYKNSSRFNALGRIDPADQAMHPYFDQAGVFVRSKVIHTFLDLFGQPEDVLWNLNNHRYQATFIKNGKRCRAYFNTDGAWLHSLNEVAEKDLPRNVYRSLKAAYIDFAISSVTELSTPKSHVWVVNLTDNDNLVVVEATPDHFTELHHYKTHF
jgi:hypothetical protein